MPCGSCRCVWAIAACTSCFLKIEFNSIRYVEMNYQSYISFVNPHSEGISADYYSGFILNPLLLSQTAFCS